ncbi:hypothetical protein ACFL2N_01555 [Pseudomonadota bacterium]
MPVYASITDKGHDPSLENKLRKQTRSDASDETFRFVALEWNNKFKHTWTDEHAVRIMRRLEKDLFPWIGDIKMDKVTPPVLLKCLRRIEARDALKSSQYDLSTILIPGRQP